MDFLGYRVHSLRFLFMPSFYAVAKGRIPGIYETWCEAEKQVKQYPGAIHKKFKNREEAFSFLSDSPPTTHHLSLSIAPMQPETFGKDIRTNHVRTRMKQQDETFIGMSQWNKADPILVDIHDDVPMNAILCDGKLQYLYAEISDDLLKQRLVNAKSTLQQKLLKTSKQRKKAALIQNVLSQYHAFKKRMSEAPDLLEIAFTDGACTSNGKLGAKASIGVYWETLDMLQSNSRPTTNTAKPLTSKFKEMIEEPFDHKSCKLIGKQTNNRAELTAIYAALRSSTTRTKSLLVCTDSSYAIKCLTDYMPKWRRNGWKRSLSTKEKYERTDPYKLFLKPDSTETDTSADVLNMDILLAIDYLRKKKEALGLQVHFLHIPSHCGIEGNELADSLASLAL
jgi:ribonuclease HI